MSGPVTAPLPHAADAVTHPVAELERRFLAFALDRLLVWGTAAVAGVLVAVLLYGMWAVVAIVAGVVVLGWLVLALMTGATGATPGKYATGLRVVHQDTGAPVGPGRGLVRSLVLGLAGLPTFGIGLATLAWTAVADPNGRRRGWHDLLARSVVVDVRPVVEVVEQEEDEGPRHIVNLTAMRLVPAPATPVDVPPRAPSGPTGPAGPTGHREAATAPPPTAYAPPPVPARAGDDPGRTVVRPKRPATAARWRLTFDTGESLVVEGPVLLGRRPEPRHGEQVRHLVPLASADMSVSKTHAQVHPAADGVLVVVDRGSTNGSVLVRQGVSRPLTAGRPTTLLAGDTVVLGDREMTVSRES